ncbi:hypothetical protein [Photobacterium sp. 53610]|uniref:hypothetical protein n=1 Tax=Photobacterium sp. 53610 TaxID=3102789 RepID=UPI002ED8048B
MFDFLASIFVFLAVPMLFYILGAIIYGIVTYIYKRAGLIHAIRCQEERVNLSNEQMKLLRKIYKRPFYDRRLYELHGTLKIDGSCYYIDEMKVHSVYWPEDKIRKVEKNQTSGPLQVQISGVIFLNSFYVTRIDQVQILSKFEPFYTLPRVMKVNPDHYDLSYLLIPASFVNMFLMLAFRYEYGHGVAYGYLTFCNVLFAFFPVGVICQEIYRQHRLYELIGVFQCKERYRDSMFQTSGEIASVPIQGHRAVFEEGEHYTVHGRIHLKPSIHIEPLLINGKNFSFSLAEKKRSLKYCIGLWLIVNVLFGYMTLNFYRSETYQEYANFTHFHVNYQVIDQIDFEQLAALNSGETIKLQDIYFTSSDDSGVLYAYDSLDETLLRRLTGLIVDRVRSMLTEPTVDASNALQRLHDESELLLRQQGAIYRQLVAAKQAVKSQAKLKIEIGERHFDVAEFSLAQVQAKIFDSSAYLSAQPLNEQQLQQQVKRALTGYLYGTAQPMHASVSFFRPQEQELVVYVYPPLPYPKDEVSAITWALYFYRTWYLLCLFMLLYSVVAYFTAERRYAHLTS